MAGCGGSPPPDLLLLTLDTTRADRFGAWGSTRGLTPHFDRLGAEGTVFSRAYVSAAVTPVSHASILTGLDPYRHGLRVLHGRQGVCLDPSVPTLAEILADRGFRTGAFVSAYPAGSDFGLARGFGRFEESFVSERSGEGGADGPVVNTGSTQRRGEETVDLAVDWILDDDRPTFTWIHLFDPHDALVVPPDEFLLRYERPEGSEEEQLRAIYDIEIAWIDAQFGRLRALLEEGGRWERTVVLVISDHGEGLGDHGWWTHDVLYEEQIRVPLLLAGPGVARGIEVDLPVAGVDVLPTFLELANVRSSASPSVDGTSLLEPVSPRTLYADALGLGTARVTPDLQDHKEDRLVALVRGSWKYIRHLARPERSELYDLDLDPDETRNRVADRPDLVREMESDLRQRGILELWSDECPRSTGGDEALRALGYVD